MAGQQLAQGTQGSGEEQVKAKVQIKDLYCTFQNLNHGCLTSVNKVAWRCMLNKLALVNRLDKARIQVKTKTN